MGTKPRILKKIIMKKIKFIFGSLFAMLLIWNCADDDNLDFLDDVVAPSNVTALMQVTQDNTGLVTITPNAVGASLFNIVFGDGNETPEEVVSGESITHTYEEGSYTVSIEAVGITGLKTVSTMPLVVSFKAPENLDIVIENDIAISKQVNVTANADFAISYEVYFGEPGNDDPLVANISETVSYTYQDPGTYTIRIVVMGAAIETTEYVEEFVVTEILQPIAPAPSQPNRDAQDVISIFSSIYTDVSGTNYFPDWGQGGQGSSWALFDLNGDEMLQYINLSYQGIALADGTSVDVSGMEFLHMDVWTSGDASRIETSLINNTPGGATEAPVWSDLTAGEWTTIEIPISDYTDQGLTVTDIFQLKLVGDPWAAGTVFVDNIYFYKPSTVATVPEYNAPSPTYGAGDVISIFSDSYTSVGISELNPNWGQTTTLTPVDINGNNIWLYEALNYTGIVTDYGNPTNLSGMDYLHFDYFTPDVTPLGFKIVNTVVGQEDIVWVSTVGEPGVRGTWVSVTIPLDDFAIDRSGVTQLLFDTAGGSAKVYVDNLYFYSETGGQPTVEAPVPTIDASDVMSIFSDSYTSVGISELNPNWGQTTTLTPINIGGNNIWQYDLLNYTGIVTDYGNPTNLSGMKYVHFDYWTPDATVLGLKIVNTVIGEEDIEFVSNIVTGTWVSVTIPLGDYDIDPSGVTQLLFDTTGASATVYIDNLYFHN